MSEDSFEGFMLTEKANFIENDEDAFRNIAMAVGILDGVLAGVVINLVDENGNPDTEAVAAMNLASGLISATILYLQRMNRI